MESKQVKELNQQRVSAANQRKAEIFEVELRAAQEQAKYHFLVAHTGMKASQNGSYYVCTANDQILGEYMAFHNLDGTKAEHWEEAFNATQNQLAALENAPYEPRTNRKEKLFMDQARYSALPEPSVLPYTREQLLEMSRKNLSKFKQLMHRNLEAVNRILRGEQ